MAFANPVVPTLIKAMKRGSYFLFYVSAAVFQLKASVSAWTSSWSFPIKDQPRPVNLDADQWQ